MPKVSNRTISVGKKRYNPIDQDEIDEEIAPVKELAKEFEVCTRDFKEKITGAKLVEDENGKRVLLLTGFKTKEKDRSKRMVKVGGEFDSSNIVAGTRRRKNVNYKSLEEKSSKVNSKNSFDKRSKLTEKLNKKKAAAKKEETEDKENVENQMADEDVAAEKKSSTKKKVQKEEWTFPLSKKNHDLMKKLGAVIRNNFPKRVYRDDEQIPDEINAFVSAKFPKDIRYTITKKCVGGHSFGLIKHEIFDLAEEECPEWMSKNPDFVILGEADNGILACKKSEAKNDFKVYLIFDATEDEEEMVFPMSLSKYLSNLKKHRIEIEEAAPQKETNAASEEPEQETAPSQEEEETIPESQELVEQSLATDAALNEKVDIMEDN